MQSTACDRIAQFHNLLQNELFPLLEPAVGALSKPAQLLVAVLSLEPVTRWVAHRRAWTGRLPHSRLSLATAFFAKAIYNLPTTRHLLERLHSDRQLRRLCGWESAVQIPGESTFSRAFAEFAATGLPAQMHEAVVRQNLQERTFDCLARDATAIEARQCLAEDKPSTPVVPTTPHLRYRTARGYHQRRKGGPHRRAKARDRGPRLQRQQHMTLSEMIADLPQQCSLGVKTSSKGHQQYWRGYKLHWDVADDGRIPISCLLTGAQVHDSQVAIPLMQMSASRIRWRYDVMDSAYDANAIRQYSAKLGHQAIIKPNRRLHTPEQLAESWTEQQKRLFAKRTVVEQLTGRLKDEFGGRLIYVRGAAKIMTHLMFGVVALTVDQLLRSSP